MKKFFHPGRMGALVCLLLSLNGCQKENLSLDPNTDSNGRKSVLDITFYALSGGKLLDKFSTINPEKVLNSASITGLQSGETILAVDFRPATGQLYGLGSTNRLYVINPETGAARMIGAGPFTPALSGNLAGFDFNPTVDRIRVVTSTGQNLRLNPETGTVAATDGNINGQPGAMIAAVAYTNNVAGATTTTLYDIDMASNKLFKQLPPNEGTLVEVGPLKLKVEGEGGFDISDKDEVGLGLFEVNKKSTLFTIDLATGDTRILAKYDKREMYTGIAIPTQPVSYAVDAMNNLLIFNPEMPSTVTAKPFSGLALGETVLGIDFRPLNGQLYALGSSSTIYTVNTSSGAAVAAGTLSIPLSGTEFGFDFNPLVDRIRIVSNTGQNLRFNPNDGTVLMDGSLNPGMPAVTAAAYTNNFAGTTTTQLFDIDTNTDKLYLQNPPNNGTLVEIGNLGINAEATNGFDISGTRGVAYALLTSGGSTKLYTINISTGTATPTGDFTSSVTSFTVGLGF
jgi:hypothetical protein